MHEHAGGNRRQARKKRGRDNGIVEMTENRKKIKITLIKSMIGTKQSHRATVRGLGLHRINSSVELEDTPAVRGMINNVYYLVKSEA